MEQQMSENRYVLDMSCGNITQILLQFSNLLHLLVLLYQLSQVKIKEPITTKESRQP